MWKSVLIITLIFVQFTLIGCSNKSEGGVENAEIITENLFSLNAECDMSVVVNYDKTRPDVAFILPDSSTQNEKSLRFENGEKQIKYFLPNAMLGDWQICYDKKDNTIFEISYESYLDKVKIKNFNLGVVTDGFMPVSFLIESKTGGTCLYKIYAYNEQNPDILLAEGSANLNNIFENTIDVNSLSDGGYKIKLEVILKYGDEIQTATQTAQAFILTVKQTTTESY